MGRPPCQALHLPVGPGDLHVQVLGHQRQHHFMLSAASGALRIQGLQVPPGQGPTAVLEDAAPAVHRAREANWHFLGHRTYSTYNPGYNHLTSTYVSGFVIAYKSIWQVMLSEVKWS